MTKVTGSNGSCIGKEKGYVLYDEVSEVLPGDTSASGDLDEILAGLDVAGIEILEEPKDSNENSTTAKTPSISSCRPASARKSTTPFACISARWAPFPSSPRG